MAQVDEILALLKKHFPHIFFKLTCKATVGDKDKKTSLKNAMLTNFFTKELDEAVLCKSIMAAIHSAKDLPDPIPNGLVVAAITEGIDPRDCLVMREGQRFEDLPIHSLIGTSSVRREDAVLKLRPDLCFVDLRGTIDERLQFLQDKKAAGVVIAEAALIRLKKTYLNRIYLPGPTDPNQGKLAVVCREDNETLKWLFSHIDARKIHEDTLLRT